MRQYIQQSREAFSIITAIFLIVIMSTLAIFVANLSGKNIQGTVAQYRTEQAILYAKSYTEFAIMALTAKSCVSTISGDIDGTATEVLQGNGYHVDVDIQYIGKNNGCHNTLGDLVTTATSQGQIVIIDTYVHYRNPDDPYALSSTPWTTNPGITYHRRTLQKL